MKLSKKNKTLLSSSVGLLAATSVVAPLATMTSCSSKQESALEELADKEFGITEETYNDLKTQFQTKYKANLINEFGEDSPQIDIHLNELKSDLNAFNEIREQRKCGFTSLTSSLIDFAKNQSDARGEKYGIKLERKTNATWAQMDALFNSWKGSFRQYMLNSDMPASIITRVMQDAQNNFVSLKKELQQTCNDACDGMIQAKSRIIGCFEGVNDDIALINSVLQLKEFMSQYTFESKASVEHQEACLDSLMKDVDDFKIGNVLSDETMNRVFTMTRKDDGKQIPFSSTIVKGFTIYPRLAKISINKVNNIHSFSMDFGIVKTSYIGKYDKEKLASITGHMYSCDNELANQLLFSDTNMSLSQVMRNMKIGTTEYPTYLTQETELKALESIYFNKNKEERDQYVTFDFEHDVNKQGYEAFFDNAKKDPTNTKLWHSSLTFNSLSNAGLTISTDGDSYESVSSIMGAMSKKSIIAIQQDKTKVNEIVNNLAETFLLNCEVHSFAEVDDSKQSVKNTFYVSYKNSIYGRYEEDFDEQRFKLSSDFYKNPMDGYHTSMKFYTRINSAFNNLVDYIELYDVNALGSKNGEDEKDTQEQIEELRTQSIIQMVISSIALTIGLVNVGYLIYSAVAPWKKAKPTERDTLSTVVGIIFSIVLLGIQATIYALFVKYYFVEIIDFYNEQKEKKRIIQNDKEIKPMFSSLRKQLDENFVRYNKDDLTYDENQIKIKKAKFDSLTMEERLNMYSKFTSKDYSAVEGMNKFNGILSDTSEEGWEGVSGEEFLKKFEAWDVGGKYWLISFGLSLVSGVISVLYAIWVKKRYAAKQPGFVPGGPDLPDYPVSDSELDPNNTELSYLVSTKNDIKGKNGNFANRIKKTMIGYSKKSSVGGGTDDMWKFYRRLQGASYKYYDKQGNLVIEAVMNGQNPMETLSNPGFYLQEYITQEEMQGAVQAYFNQAYTEEMDEILKQSGEDFNSEHWRKQKDDKVKDAFWEGMGFKKDATDRNKPWGFTSLFKNFVRNVADYDDDWMLTESIDGVI